MGGVTRILLGKDKRNGFDWYTLIYDSHPSAIPEKGRVFFLAKIKGMDLIGTLLSMTPFILLAIALSAG